MGGTLEDDGDLADPLAQALACAQIEGDARPTASVHIKSDGRIGLGGGGAVDAVLIQVADHMLGALPSGCVLASGGVGRHILGNADCGKNLGFLGRQV